MPALAGRPLATDDAATVGAGRCQLEAWAARGADHSRNIVVSPACGASETTEVGIELARSRPSLQTVGTAAVALKWVPGVEWAGVAFGVKAFATGERARPGGWDRSDSGAFAIASRPLADGLMTLHLNVGASRVHAERRTLALAKAAAAWQATDRWLPFAEIEAKRHTPTTQSAGLRWWCVPGQLGLDVTASREVGISGSRRYAVGFGWYGGAAR